MASENSVPRSLTVTGDVTAILPMPDNSVSPVRIFGNEKIRNGFDAKCLDQAVNSRLAPGVTDLVLNPDAHAGYGVPVGCTMVSPSHIYPGPVGVDIKCSMSLLQLDLPESELVDKKVRRAMINALLERLPTGAGGGQRSVKKGRYVSFSLGKKVVVGGASKEVCSELGIPAHWTLACEDSFHVGHDDSTDALERRFTKFEKDIGEDYLGGKIRQLGSYGAGNHFGEANTVRVQPGQEELARHFGLSDGKIAFLSHCGSRGLGHMLAQNQFKVLQQKFAEWKIPLPGNDRELVYAPLGTPEANDYLDDMALGANFATVNHLLINALVLEAFQEIFPGVKGDLVYFISHNIARKELVGSGSSAQMSWVHRKGATRAFPAGHPALAGGKYETTGHPILLPGNPAAGSVVMVAESGAAQSCFSVNHGAGRAMSRTRAIRELQQKDVEATLEASDVISNCRTYPRDEAPQAYKNFGDVIDSVEKAGLARTVAKLSARFVMKDGDKSNGGVA